MANFYEDYQIPYDFSQVNLYDYNHYHQQQQFGYDPMRYNWNGSESASAVYSVSTMSEPKHLFYDPNLYTTYESPPEFRIYYSVQGFNEPEFDDYDPTPYGGGYDIVATYGKPLPTSVETCYPSSTAAQKNPPSPPEIISPVPIGIYDGGEKKLGKKKQVSFSEPLESVKEEECEDEEEEGEEEDEEEEEEEEDEDDSSSYGTDKTETVDKEEVKALYVPSGYGLEATDLCEVIFGGYFPCVLRNKRRQEEEKDGAGVVSCWESNDSDPWKNTSDYLFGDLYPYGNDNRTGRNQFEISSYGYQSYH